MGIHSRPSTPERRQLIRTTWLEPTWQALGLDFVFILTNSEEEKDLTDRILKENEEFGDIVVVPGRENDQHESGWKSWGLFKWAGRALGSERYKFVLKVRGEHVSR